MRSRLEIDWDVPQLKYQGQAENTLTDMLEAQVIKQSTSDWASAPALVSRKNGKVRYTVDYR